jgi:hypothetical protein
MGRKSALARSRPLLMPRSHHLEDDGVFESPPMKSPVVSILVLAALLAAGCATRFPAPADTTASADGLSADAIFERCLAAHGGDLRDHPGDLNLSMTGRWYRAIKRLQPVVTDAGFRISAEERFLPREQLHVVVHRGPEGEKRVLRRPGGIEVFYNGVRETDPAKLRATAMTTDAFQLFHFGPSFIRWRAAVLARLDDATEDGRRFHRLLATVRPGFGESQSDQVVLWVDSGNYRLYRVHITLDGFESTRGAHVDTTFMDYRQVGPFLLPVRFHERVRGPLRIEAHRWWTTGADIDRGWDAANITGPEFTGLAGRPATPLDADATTAR